MVFSSASSAARVSLVLGLPAAAGVHSQRPQHRHRQQAAPASTCTAAPQVLTHTAPGLCLVQGCGLPETLLTAALLAVLARVTAAATSAKPAGGEEGGDHDWQQLPPPGATSRLHDSEHHCRVACAVSTARCRISLLTFMCACCACATYMNRIV